MYSVRKLRAASWRATVWGPLAKAPGRRRLSEICLQPPWEVPREYLKKSLDKVTEWTWKFGAHHRGRGIWLDCPWPEWISSRTQSECSHLPWPASSSQVKAGREASLGWTESWGQSMDLGAQRRPAKPG
jgi:hypothetical protein